MISEETALLRTPAQIKHDALYERFPAGRKRIILAVVSWAGLLPLFAGGCFIPAVPSIAKEFESTPSIVSLAVSLSVLTTAIASLVLSSYSGYYGKRAIYLLSFPVFILGSLAVASARNVSQLLAFRVVQAMGSAGGISLGAGVISDIWKLEERGTAMGWFFSAILVAPAISPLAGGMAAYFASWRIMQIILAGMGLVAFFSILVWLPETSHPNTMGREKEGAPQGLVALNPFECLSLLRSPNLVCVTFASATALITDYVLLIPLAFTIAVKYHITNPALIGLCFLPLGVGNLVGAPLAGWLSDKTIIKMKAKRGGVWVPEDRLRGTLLGAGVFVPVSVLASGLLTEYVDGPIGLTLNMICLFVNGIGVDFVLSPSGSYCVDIVHSRSAEVMAANGALRSLVLAGSSACVIPLIDRFGIVPVNTSAAILAWVVGYGLLWCTIQYGDRMRAWVDVGYSTPDTN